MGAANRAFDGRLAALLVEIHAAVVRVRRKPTSTITVPVPDHKEIRIGTLQSIIRQSQLPRALFEVES
jgi:hypothetical protein